MYMIINLYCRDIISLLISKINVSSDYDEYKKINDELLKKYIKLEELLEYNS